MEDLTKHILKKINNEHTKVELKEDFKGNYYSYVVDTIYIAKNFGNKKVPKSVENMNKKAAELIVVCHECIHSIQNKYMHILNTIFSNLSMILTIISIVIGVLWTSPLWLKIATIIALLISIIIRLILEVGAINNSIKLASDIVSNGMVEGVSNEDIEEGTKYIEKNKCLALLQMIIDKIIFLVLIFVI